jgi:hypothetical protein
MKGTKEMLGSVKKTGKRGMKTVGDTVKRMVGSISHATGSGRGFHRNVSRKGRTGS